MAEERPPCSSLLQFGRGHHRPDPDIFARAGRLNAADGLFTRVRNEDIDSRSIENRGAECATDSLNRDATGTCEKVVALSGAYGSPLSTSAPDGTSLASYPQAPR